eukprot:4420593-Prymnesium_polylepis.1
MGALALEATTADAIDALHKYDADADGRLGAPPCPRRAHARASAPALRSRRSRACTWRPRCLRPCGPPPSLRPPRRPLR